jgi:hypothetical protein
LLSLVAVEVVVKLLLVNLQLVAEAVLVVF